MKLAILIDADNIAPADADEIFATAAKLGEPITRRAFGSLTVFTGKEGWKAAVREHAIEARPQVNNIDRKNTADFALIIDAMDCLAVGRYDGFVLVSSDSDFTSLAQRLRDDGKDVYGIGDDRAPQSFRKACTQFFELKKKAPPPAPKQPKPKQPEPPAPPAPKQPTEFQKILDELRKRKCKKRATLQNFLMKNYKKPTEEAEKIIGYMIYRGFISVDENNKVTWP